MHFQVGDNNNFKIRLQTYVGSIRPVPIFSQPPNLSLRRPVQLSATTNYHRSPTCNAPPSESPPPNVSVTETAFTAPHGPESRRTQIPNCSISSPRTCSTSRPRVHSTLLAKHSSSLMTSPSTSSKTLPALCSSRSICPQREESEQHASRG